MLLLFSPNLEVDAQSKKSVCYICSDSLTPVHESVLYFQDDLKN